ncbi:hypothetical protein V7112_22360, partial [Bacillus sp. JJ1566]|uniref:hypothetical protein n=1 Tax=Bacillus sp. JJ1566 TaxID=3122961 RepID=UPI0030001ADE
IYRYHNKYDGFFKSWIGVEREELLKEIAMEIGENKTSLEEVASSYGLRVEDLENQLLKFKPLFMGKDIVEEQSECSHEVKTLSDSNDMNNSSFSIQEIQILKKIIKEWEVEKAQTTNGTQKVSLFLERDLLEELEMYAEMNSVSKSNIVGKAIEQYLKIWK